MPIVSPMLLRQMRIMGIGLTSYVIQHACQKYQLVLFDVLFTILFKLPLKAYIKAVRWISLADMHFNEYMLWISQVMSQGLTVVTETGLCPLYAHMRASLRESASHFFSVISHLRGRDRVTRLKPCLAPWRRHHIRGGLVSSQKVLMELCFGICTCRSCCSRDGECRGGEKGGETSLSVKLLKGDMASVERIAASVLLSFPRQHT